MKLRNILVLLIPIAVGISTFHIIDFLKIDKQKYNWIDIAPYITGLIILIIILWKGAEKIKPD